MLNSLEIAQELSLLGYKLIVSNAHANGYEHPDFSGRVFVKMSKTGKPVFQKPLLIHPDHQGRAAWGGILSLSPNQPDLEYRNTNMTGFPKVSDTDSKQAIALDISDIPDLHRLLELLGHKEFSVSPKLQTEITECSQIDSALSANGVPETERNAVIRARIGQGAYRDTLIAYWKGCSVTGCIEKRMLRASHAKPWRVCSDDERLDPFNGLLLTPNLDLAFDQGLISFADDGSILLSSELDQLTVQTLNLRFDLCLRQIESRHRDYLAWHRNHLFRK